MRRLVLFLLVVPFAVPALVLAGTTGKIKGKVTDKETKEALVGATVQIQGTTLGGSTNAEGEYTILNIPAGTYTLRTNYVGYSPTTVSNVRVNNDLTTELSLEVESEAVSLQGMEIVAERPIVNKNATNAVRITTSEDIGALPVRGINNIVALSPGVVLQDNTVFIRGGRQDEVGFYLEGVSITNPMLGGRAVNLVQDAVEEIQVQAGGYNAEFGGANSGIIQQQLRSGTSDIKASLHYVTDNLSFSGKSKAFDGKKRLGAYWYGYNELTATLSGPVLDERFKFFGLFNYNYQRDATPQAYPGINLGRIGDPTSGDTITLNYAAGALAKNPLEQYTGTGTLTLDFTPLTFRLAGTYTGGKGYNAFNGSRNQGNIANILDLDRLEEVNQKNGAVSLKITHLLSPSTFYEVTGGYFIQSQTNFDPILREDYLSYGDSVANAAAGVIWQRNANDARTGTTGRYQRPTSLSVLGFAFNAPGDVMSTFGKFKRTNISLTAALYSQVGKEHSIKIGGDFQRHTIRNYFWGNNAVMSLPNLIATNDALPDGDPNKLTREQLFINAGVNAFGYDVFGNETSASGVVGAKHPIFASGYIQDKIEYQDLVLNAGLRFDYISTDNYTLIDPTRPERSINYNTGEINEAGLVKTAAFSSVSPRIGLSFPVSDRTVFHTQYGKFVQQSRLRDIYQGLYATGANLRGGFFIGNPVGFDVRPTRTTQYEVGFTQQVSDFASFDITAYYKDIKDQIVTRQINTATGSPFGAYAVLANGDFATTKGLEITFNMRRQKRIQINANLSFQDARGTGSFPNSNRGIVGAPLDGVTIFTPQYVSPLEFNNAVRGSINLDYHFAKNDGPSALQQAGISLLMSFNSGHPFTRGIGGQSLEQDARDRQPIEAMNSSTTPWVLQVDLRIDKSFDILDRLAANVYLQVINLFDTRNIQNVFLRTGSTDDDGFLSNPEQGGRLTATYGPQYASMYKAINLDYSEQYQAAPFLATAPQFYGPPRQVRLGVRLDY
jgi:hypothetical protein